MVLENYVSYCVVVTFVGGVMISPHFKKLETTSKKLDLLSVVEHVRSVPATRSS